MANYVYKNASHIKYLAEAAIYPVHMATISHMYLLAMCIAIFSCLAYLVAMASKAQVESE